MSFLDSIAGVKTFTEHIISESDNHELREVLQPISLYASRGRRERSSRLRKGIKLMKAMSSRASDITSVTTETSGGLHLEIGD